MNNELIDLGMLYQALLQAKESFGYFKCLLEIKQVKLNNKTLEMIKHQNKEDFEHIESTLFAVRNIFEDLFEEENSMTEQQPMLQKENGATKTRERLELVVHYEDEKLVFDNVNAIAYSDKELEIHYETKEGDFVHEALSSKGIKTFSAEIYLDDQQEVQSRNNIEQLEEDQVLVMYNSYESKIFGIFTDLQSAFDTLCDLVEDYNTETDCLKIEQFDLNCQLGGW